MQEDYFHFQYFIPPGIPRAETRQYPHIIEIGATIRNKVIDEGADIPDTPLTVRLRLPGHAAIVEFDYEGKLAYQNFCCFEEKYFEEIYSMVWFRFKGLGLGEPEWPLTTKWIHLVPVAGPMPEPEYSLLSQQWAFAYFCMFYARQLAGAEPL